MQPERWFSTVLAARCGIPIYVAIAAVMMSCVFTGLIGTLVYARRCAARSRWS